MIIENERHLEEKVVHEKAKIYKKYVDDSFEINIYQLDLGFNFTLTLPNGYHGKEIYWLSKGLLKQTTTNRLIREKDMIILSEEDPCIGLEVLEDTEIILISSEDSYNQTESNFTFLEETIEKIQNKDTYTKEHSLRVMALAHKMIPYLNLSEGESYAFLRAAKYHDLGKVTISDNILNKPAFLSDDEFNQMKNHVDESVLQLKEHYKPLVLQIASEHHERLDGSGYPKGLKGDQISSLGKALAVIDTYDAMTTDRVYKKGKAPEVALKELYSLANTKYSLKYIELLDKILNSTA
jgi:HD-GYP domain-containing protein (c-di-GMP phosphodiesterase class II)